MKYKIELPDNWRPDKRSFYTPGVYRVPEDLSEALAELAVSEGGAKRLEAPGKFRPAAPTKRPYARKVSGPAPENKSPVVWPVRGRGNRAESDGGGSGNLPE